jgi:hypothetical protein
MILKYNWNQTVGKPPNNWRLKQKVIHNAHVKEMPPQKFIICWWNGSSCRSHAWKRGALGSKPTATRGKNTENP